MRTWGVATLVAAALLVTAGCGEDRPHPLAADASPTVVPTYADSMPPVKAVMSLVPPTATTLEVTDYDRVKIMLGLESVAGRASAADQQALWTQADHQSAQFTHGLLRSVDGTLRSRYRWGAADVKWEATFTGGTGVGMVIRVANGIDPTAAIRAGIGPLKGAAYDAQRHLITKGTVAIGQESWGSDPAILAVAGEPAASTYVAKGCSAAKVAPGTRLKPVAAYSVGIGDGLATVWVGKDREDLFERMRLGDGVPAYRQTFISPVGDPTAGRMGFKVSSPVAAASLVARQPLPFAACG